MVGIAEALLIAGLVVLLYRAAAPLRRWLEGWIARRLGHPPSRRSGRVVVLERRRNGTFEREDDHGG
jgi:hypothetical protein